MKLKVRHERVPLKKEEPVAEFWLEQAMSTIWLRVTLDGVSIKATNGNCPIAISDDKIRIRKNADEHAPCQLESCRYHLTEKQGKRIRLYLKLYSARLHEFGAREEGDEVWELAKLFE